MSEILKNNLSLAEINQKVISFSVNNFNNMRASKLNRFNSRDNQKTSNEGGDRK